jgi:hypothetical protein
MNVTEAAPGGIPHRSPSLTYARKHVRVARGSDRGQNLYLRDSRVNDGVIASLRHFGWGFQPLDQGVPQVPGEKIQLPAC